MSLKETAMQPAVGPPSGSAQVKENRAAMALHARPQVVGKLDHNVVKPVLCAS